MAIECNIWPTVSGGNGMGKPTQTTISEGGFIDNHWDASHFKGFNAAFADGHVKRWSLGQMSNQLVCWWDLPKAP